jgi:hypothetical protein
MMPVPLATKPRGTSLAKMASLGFCGRREGGGPGPGQGGGAAWGCSRERARRPAAALPRCLPAGARRRRQPGRSSPAAARRATGGGGAAPPAPPARRASARAAARAAAGGGAARCHPAARLERSRRAPRPPVAAAQPVGAAAGAGAAPTASRGRRSRPPAALAPPGPARAAAGTRARTILYTYFTSWWAWPAAARNARENSIFLFFCGIEVWGVEKVGKVGGRGGGGGDVRRALPLCHRPPRPADAGPTSPARSSEAITGAAARATGRRRAWRRGAGRRGARVESRESSAWRGAARPHGGCGNKKPQPVYRYRTGPGAPRAKQGGCGAISGAPHHPRGRRAGGIEGGLGGQGRGPAAARQVQRDAGRDDASARGHGEVRGRRRRRGRRVLFFGAAGRRGRGRAGAAAGRRGAAGPASTCGQLWRSKTGPEPWGRRRPGRSQGYGSFVFAAFRFLGARRPLPRRSAALGVCRAGAPPHTHTCASLRRASHGYTQGWQATRHKPQWQGPIRRRFKPGARQEGGGGEPFATSATCRSSRTPRAPPRRRARARRRCRRRRGCRRGCRPPGCSRACCRGWPARCAAWRRRCAATWRRRRARRAHAPPPGGSTCRREVSQVRRGGRERAGGCQRAPRGPRSPDRGDPVNAGGACPPPSPKNALTCGAAPRPPTAAAARR